MTSPSCPRLAFRSRRTRRRRVCGSRSPQPSIGRRCQDDFVDLSRVIDCSQHSPYDLKPRKRWHDQRDRPCETLGAATDPVVRDRNGACRDEARPRGIEEREAADSRWWVRRLSLALRQFRPWSSQRFPHLVWMLAGHPNQCLSCSRRGSSALLPLLQGAL